MGRNAHCCWSFVLLFPSLLSRADSGVAEPPSTRTQTQEMGDIPDLDSASPSSTAEIAGQMAATSLSAKEDKDEDKMPDMDDIPDMSDDEEDGMGGSKLVEEEDEAALKPSVCVHSSLSLPSLFPIPSLPPLPLLASSVAHLFASVSFLPALRSFLFLFLPHSLHSVCCRSRFASLLDPRRRMGSEGPAEKSDS